MMVEQKIKKTKNEISQYMELIDQMLSQTLQGALDDDWDAVRDVIDNLEPQANGFKIEISQDCLGILALFHPEASHLRSILKMSGMGSDLERMGDMVTKIAFSLYHWKDMNQIHDYPKVIAMVHETRKMLADVKRAFLEENCLAAIAVIQHDDRVDELRTRNLKHLIKDMNQAEDVEHLLQIMNIIRNLERIGDLCTHLAEDIIFIKEGLVPNKDKK